MIEIAFLMDYPEAIPTLTHWFRAQWPAYYAARTPAAIAQDFCAEAKRDGLPVRLVAFADGELAGTITLRDQATWTLPAYHPGLGGLLVAAKHRGRGIGTALVSAGMNVAHEQGYERVYATTVMARGILERLGWKLVQTVAHDDEQLLLYGCTLEESGLRPNLESWRKTMKDQFFADYLERLEGLQHRLHQAVQDLPAAAMDWSPGPEMNSIAVLLAHITGVLHEGIDLALDNPPSRVRAQEFQTHGVSSAEMLRRLDAVIDYARYALPRLGLEDLAQARKDEDGMVTCGWALLHALEHAYLHLGHLQVTCQLWRQGAVR